MLVDPLEINDLLILRPNRIKDSRGYFTEIYNKKTFLSAGISCEFVQDNESLSTDIGTLRGLHFQVSPSPQAKLVRVIRGAVFDVAVDVRNGSPSFGRWCGVALTSDVGEMLFIPAGFAHAYVTLERDTIVAYKVDHLYNKSAERGLRWDDPDIAIDWPVSRDRIKVSDKDAQLSCLRDVTTPFVF